MEACSSSSSALLQKEEMSGGGTLERPSDALEDKRKADVLRRPSPRRPQGDLMSNSIITGGSEGTLSGGDLCQVVNTPRRPMVTTSRGSNTLANSTTPPQKHTTTPSSCTEGIEGEGGCCDSGRDVAGEGSNSDGVDAGHLEDSTEGDPCCAREESGENLRSDVADDSCVKEEETEKEGTDASLASSLVSGRCQAQRRKEDAEFRERMADGEKASGSFEKSETRGERKCPSFPDLSISFEAPSCSGNTTGVGLCGEVERRVKLDRCHNSSDSERNGSCSPTSKAKEGKDLHHSKALGDDKTSSVDSPPRGRRETEDDQVYMRGAGCRRTSRGTSDAERTNGCCGSTDGSSAKSL